mgnify:CR=1 FL=1
MTIPLGTPVRFLDNGILRHGRYLGTVYGCKGEHLVDVVGFQGPLVSRVLPEVVK